MDHKWGSWSAGGQGRQGGRRDPQRQLSGFSVLTPSPGRRLAGVGVGVGVAVGRGPLSWPNAEKAWDAEPSGNKEAWGGPLTGRLGWPQLPADSQGRETGGWRGAEEVQGGAGGQGRGRRGGGRAEAGGGEEPEAGAEPRWQPEPLGARPLRLSRVLGAGQSWSQEPAGRAPLWEDRLGSIWEGTSGWGGVLGRVPGRPHHPEPCAVREVEERPSPLGLGIWSRG